MNKLALKLNLLEYNHERTICEICTLKDCFDLITFASNRKKFHSLRIETFNKLCLENYCV